MAERTGDDVLKMAGKQDVKFVELWFVDILGQVKSFTITNSELERAMEKGMGFDGSSITGYQDIEESDMVAVPDSSTFRMIPWTQEEGKKTARMICDVVTCEKQFYAGDPRFVLKRALKRMKDMGFEHYYLGPELEYFYFKNDQTAQILDRGGYFDLTTLDVAGELRRDTILALEDMGIPVEYSHHEVGSSQHEIDIKYADALKMSDSVITYRIVVKEIARKHGVYATFMPKPLFGENGSGMHVHQSLFKNGKNAFFSADEKYHLSDTGRKFIAGQLKHAREMSLLGGQWVNSYKRLVPGYEAPVYLSWSRKNRSALIRVPSYEPDSEEAMRVELRCPDPACNPYLTFAAMLHAGLEGIEKDYKLQEPMEKNLYHLSADERKRLGIESLPDNLGEAVMVTEQSELVKKALGDHIFSRFIELKKQEWEDYRVQVTKYELDKFLPVL